MHATVQKSFYYIKSPVSNADIAIIESVFPLHARSGLLYWPSPQIALLAGNPFHHKLYATNHLGTCGVLQ